MTGVRRRRTNVSHVEPTEDTVELKKDASDEDVLKALEKAKKTTTVKPTAKAKAK